MNILEIFLANKMVVTAVILLVFFYYTQYGLALPQIGGGATGAPFSLQQPGTAGINLHEDQHVPYMTKETDVVGQYASTQSGGNPGGVSCKFLYDGSASDRDCIGHNGYPLDQAYSNVSDTGYKIGW